MARTILPFLGTGLALLILVIMTSPQSADGFLRNFLGTPYLYIPQSYVVDPDAPRKNAPEYQRVHGYRAKEYLENINQRTIEGNPRIYDVEDSTRTYSDYNAPAVPLKMLK